MEFTMDEGVLRPGRRMRRAKSDDLPTIRSIYAYARRQMAANGNLTQWGDRYPLEETVLEDIAFQRSMLLVDEENGRERVLAQFAACTGADPTYAQIDGTWLDDDDYATLHRIASSGVAHHSAQDCLNWMLEIYGNVRVDTHPNNRIMQHILESNGFTRCGTIMLSGRDGDGLRVAYQRHLK